MIPPLIHQTWKTHDIPFFVYPRDWVDSWQRLNPGMRRILWTDDDLVMLARAYYPAFARPLETMRGITRADIGRLLVLHRYGGLYTDLDYLCLRPFAPLLTDDLCLPGWPMPGRTYYHNALMASAPGSDFLLRVAESSLSRWAVDPNQAQELLGGPVALMMAMERQAVPHRMWTQAEVCPIDWHDWRAPHGWRDDPAAAFPDAYAVTSWNHNWGGTQHD